MTDTPRRAHDQQEELDRLRERVAQLEAELVDLRAVASTHHGMVWQTRHPVFALDAEGRFLEANPALQAFLGRSLDQVRGRKVDRVLWADDDFSLRPAPGWYREPGDHALRFQVAGLPRAMLVTLMRFDADEGPTFWAIGRETTTEMEAAEARRASEEKFQKAFQAAPIWVVLSELETGRYMEVNEAFLRQTGFTRQEVVGRTALELKVWPQASQRREVVRLLKATGSVRNLEVTRRAKDGNFLTMLYSGEVIEVGGKACLLSISLDISERQQAELTRRSLEDRFRALVENSSEGIVLRDHAGRITYVNRAFVNMVQANEAQDLMGLPYLDFIPPAERPESVARIQGNLEGRLAPPREHHLRGLQGRLVPVESTGVSIQHDGQPMVLGVFRDFTRRQRYEEELRRSQARYRTLADATFEAAFILEAGRCTDTNQAACELFGYDLSELMGRELADLIAPAWRDGVRRHLDSGQESPLEIMAQRRDGSQFQAAIRASLAQQREGMVWVVVIRDLTDRQRALAAMEASERLHRVIFEKSPIPMGIQDFSEAKAILDQLPLMEEAELKAYLRHRPELVDRLALASRFVFVNQALTDLYKARDAQHLLTSLNQVLLPDDREHFLDQVASFRMGRTTYRSMARNLDMEGGTLEILIHKQHMPGHEATWDQVMLSLVDVTERNRSQREKEKLASQLQQARKMEAIGTLAGGIAHDFNNLLAAIMGFAELAQHKARRGQGLEVETGHIIQAVERARHLIQHILTFSRKVDLAPEPLDLNQEVRRAAQMLERTLPKMIGLETVLEPNLPLINGDPTQIEQALLNLATNAADAMPEGGRLSLETKAVYLDQEYCRQHLEVTPGYYVLLQVSDTGVGIPPEIQGQIFDPFFTTKGPGKGTGLGLSSVFGVVKGHGGHVFCYSAPDLGTIFKLYFPVLSPAANTAPRGHALDQPLAGGKETILLVDDEEILRRMGEGILGEMGYRVMTAATGEEALEVYGRQGGQIDLVLLDLGMPGMGGKRCLAEMVARHPEARVVIASGYAANGLIKESLAAGARGFIAKPFRASELLGTVRRVLDQE